MGRAGGKDISLLFRMLAFGLPLLGRLVGGLCAVLDLPRGGRGAFWIVRSAPSRPVIPSETRPATLAMRHPIAVIGSGIAGLMACQYLNRAQAPVLLIDAAQRHGGMLASVRLGSAVADMGIQYLHRRDHALMELVRSVGLDRELVVIQGGVRKVNAAGRIAPAGPKDIDTGRCALECGMQGIADAMDRLTEDLRNAPVHAVRWDDADRFFWFETAADRPLCWPKTATPLQASGVVLAVDLHAAQDIVANSPALRRFRTPLATLRTVPQVVGAYLIDRLKTDVYAYEGSNHPTIEWIGFEERKSPRRVGPGQSLVVVTATPAHSEKLLKGSDDEALASLYVEARKIVPTLPERTHEMAIARWPYARLAGPPLAQADSIAAHLSMTEPAGIPFAIAGTYVLGASAEQAAESGIIAARIVARAARAQSSAA